MPSPRGLTKPILLEQMSLNIQKKRHNLEGPGLRSPLAPLGRAGGDHSIRKPRPRALRTVDLTAAETQSACMQLFSREPVAPGTTNERRPPPTHHLQGCDTGKTGSLLCRARSWDEAICREQL